MWLVNGSPTPKSSDETVWASREAKQIMLPVHFPGQFADFNDYGEFDFSDEDYIFFQPFKKFNVVLCSGSQYSSTRVYNSQR